MISDAYGLVTSTSDPVAVAADALAEARRAIAARDGGTGDEQALVAALALAVDGRFGDAAARLDDGFADRPAAFLPFKLAHALRFMRGDAAGMLAASDRMLEDWREDDAAAGFLLGCHAFALEEHGHYAAAEAFGRRAVALQPEDAWGLHAVGHVHEMRADADAGIAWLEAGRPHWSRCNNFSFHMAWHLGLLHLERGDHERVLEIYDGEVRPQPTDDFRDVANAVSLLWRLDRSGVDVGERWDDLAEVARKRRTDTTLVFAALHTLMALVAIGDRGGVAEMVAALGEKAAGGCDQAKVAAAVGLPLARVIASLGSGTAAFGERSVIASALKALPSIGGSNAQRDVFVLALADAAGRRGDTAALTHVRAARRHLKTEDRLIAALDRRPAKPLFFANIA